MRLILSGYGQAGQQWLDCWYAFWNSIIWDASISSLLEFIVLTIRHFPSPTIRWVLCQVFQQLPFLHIFISFCHGFIWLLHLFFIKIIWGNLFIPIIYPFWKFPKFTSSGHLLSDCCVIFLNTSFTLRYHIHYEISIALKLINIYLIFSLSIY